MESTSVGTEDILNSPLSNLVAVVVAVARAVGDLTFAEKIVSTMMHGFSDVATGNVGAAVANVPTNHVILKRGKEWPAKQLHCIQPAAASAVGAAAVVAGAVGVDGIV